MSDQSCLQVAVIALGCEITLSVASAQGYGLIASKTARTGYWALQSS